MNIVQKSIYIFLVSALYGCMENQSIVPTPQVMPAFELNEWAPIGAKWYFSDASSGLSPKEGNGYYLIESVRDTTVENIDAKVLEITYYYLDEIKYKDIEVMHGDMEKVYHWDANENDFYLLYDFTVKTGDTVKLRDKPFINYWGRKTDYFISIVDSLGYESIYDFSLKKYKMRAYPNDKGTYWQYAEGGAIAEVIQGIGSTFWMFGGQEFSLQYVKAHIGLRCFEYQGYIYKNKDYPLDCDYINPNPE